MRVSYRMQRADVALNKDEKLKLKPRPTLLNVERRQKQYFHSFLQLGLSS